MTTLYQTIAPLTDELRIDARERAAKIVLKSVGDRPHRSQFQNSSISKYPMWFTRLIGGLMAVVFIAAAMPSLFRLFSAGRDYFLSGINDHWQAAIVGVSTFLLSEFLIVLSTIVARVYFTGKARLIFIIPVVMGLLMALVGNWTVVNPHDVFSFLEAVIPVFAVLFIALIGERIILESLETRHANERAYQEALQSWQIASSTPEQHPRYIAALANALRDSLKVLNEQGPGASQRKALMSAFTVDHWKPLVWREMQADQWYAVDTGAPAELPALPALPESVPPQRRKAKETEAGTVEIEPRPFGNIPPIEEGNEFISMIAPVSVNGGIASSNGNGNH